MLDLEADFSKTIATLDKLSKKQIPFAASQAINDVATSATVALRAQAQTKLDRPTPFTLRGFKVQRSHKRNLVAYVYVDRIQERYMKYQIEGGTRKAGEVGGIAVPVNIKTNKYGNIPGKRRGLANRKNRFIAERNGTRGVWIGKRTKKAGSTIQLGAYFAKSATYKKIFPFYKIVRGVVESKMTSAFHKRLNAALASAK